VGASEGLGDAVYGGLDSDGTLHAQEEEGWPCPSCTFVNKPPALLCEMCSGEKVEVSTVW